MIRGSGPLYEHQTQTVAKASVGLAIAKALIGVGYHVTLFGRNEGRLREAAKTLGAEASWRRADVGPHEDVRASLIGSNDDGPVAAFF